MSQLTLGYSLELYGGEVGIDRKTHKFIIGATGTGKSTVMLRMMKEDFYSPNPVFLMEPHGPLVRQAAENIPSHRTRKVLIVRPSDKKVIGLNPLAGKDKDKNVERIMSTFGRMWGTSFLHQSQHFTRHFLQGIVEVEPRPTLLHLSKLLNNEQYFKEVFSKVKSLHLKQFAEWFQGLPYRERQDATMPLQNKFGKFVANENTRVLLGQNEWIDIGKFLNDGYIILCDLNKSELGEDVSSFLSSLLLSEILEKAYEKPRNAPFWSVYVDEFHNASHGNSAEHILSETRKYGVGLCVADQTIEQLPEGSEQPLFGNCGTILVGRVGAKDAERLAKELDRGNPSELQGLPRGQWLVKRVIDGTPYQTRKIEVHKSLQMRGDEQDYEEVVYQSRRRHGKDREEVIAQINKLLG